MSAVPRILIINDEEAVSRYFKEKIAQAGDYEISLEHSGLRAIEAQAKERFDVVILKRGMPDMNTKEIADGLKKIDPECIIIALFEEKDLALAPDELVEFGLYDFITKSVGIDKLLFLVRKGVELRDLTTSHNKLMSSLKEQNVSLHKQNTLLARRIEESTKNLTKLYEDLRSTYMRTIKVLAHAIDARDHYTHSHSENVAKYAVTIAKELHLPLSEIERISEACELHDLGKIGVGDDILSKASSLNEQEWEKIRRHPITGAQILEPLTFLNGVIELVRQHHERYDGAGYPNGLRGEDILLGARIIHLADAYEAMTSARSYRKEPFSKEKAIEEIRINSGKQFDPKIVEAFLKVANKL